jgi:DNA-binding LytR/AlgR family response regulator
MEQRTLEPPGGEMEGVFSEAFQQTFERTPVGVTLLDPPDRIRYANPALQQLAPAVDATEYFQDLLSLWSQKRLQEEALPRACRDGHWHGDLALAGETGGNLVRMHLIAAHTPQGPAETPWIAMLHSAEETRAGGAEPITPLLQRLSVPLQKETRLLDPSEIHLFEADRHYTHLYTAQETLLASQPLAGFQRQLTDAPFIRTHRSYLVNLHQVRGLRRDGSHCYLRVEGLPNLMVPVSRRRLARVEALLGLRPLAAAS